MKSAPLTQLPEFGLERYATSNLVLVTVPESVDPAGELVSE
jgi:hypothetical protein